VSQVFFTKVNATISQQNLALPRRTRVSQPVGSPRNGRASICCFAAHPNLYVCRGVSLRSARRRIATRLARAIHRAHPLQRGKRSTRRTDQSSVLKCFSAVEPGWIGCFGQFCQPGERENPSNRAHALYNLRLCRILAPGKGGPDPKGETAHVLRPHPSPPTTPFPPVERVSASATPAQESLRKGQLAKPRAFLRPCNSRNHAFTTATDSLSCQEAIWSFPDGSGSRRSPRLIRCKAASRYPNSDPRPALRPGDPSPICHRPRCGSPLAGTTGQGGPT